MISTIWTKNLKSKKDKDDFEVVLRNSTIITSRIRDIIQERLHDVTKVSTRDYDSQNWSHLQAHKNGRQEELQFLLDILDLKADRGQ